jgi:hypothetical protein
MNRVLVYKVKDRNDTWSDDMYYTIKGLRDIALNSWYDTWDETLFDPQDYTKEQIQNSDEDLFSWLNGWGYDIETILEITEDDFPKY